MKQLQNKQTGQIVSFIGLCVENGRYELAVRLNETDKFTRFYYDSLAELQKEWGEYETRKGFKEFTKFRRGFFVSFYDEETAEKAGEEWNKNSIKFILAGNRIGKNYYTFHNGKWYFIDRSSNPPKVKEIRKKNEYGR